MYKRQVQKLEKKLESLEKSQETMKAVNAYYRKHKTLDGCPHLSPEQLEKLKYISLFVIHPSFRL